MNAEPGRALACRLLSEPTAPFGLRIDVMLLCHALARLDHGQGTDRDLDADIYEALGWDVLRGRVPGRRLSWRRRSPISRYWETLPTPTGNAVDAAGIVPWGWSWSAGIVEGQARAWCREERPRSGARGPRYTECNRLTVARALTAAGLHGHRQIIGDGTVAVLAADPLPEGARHA